MSSNEVAIQVTGLSKCYEIYDHPGDRLRQFIYPRLAKLFGKKSKQYFYEFWALKNISFEVRKGETLGVIGKNGSGKSTLLQLICGTLNPTAGNIQVKGVVAAILELGSGFNSEFTGRENIFLSASVYGLSSEKINNRLQTIIEFADIGDFIDQPVKTYSSGMVVRLAFAVIAHVDADILVIDEALAVGDAFFNQKCMRFLREFMKSGTVLFVTHDTAAITSLCTKGVLLNGGSIVKVGSPKEVCEVYLSEIYNSIEGLRHEEHSEPQLNKVCAQTHGEYRDMRESLINSSSLRNDIEVLKFSPDENSLGTGHASIKSVRLLDADGCLLSWIIGGEDVILEIQSYAYLDIQRPIIGFQIKDRHGQVIFGDNTYLIYKNQPILVLRGKTIAAKFKFRLPVLPTGDYCIAVGIAEGTQESHVMHCWIHEGMFFRVHSSSVPLGLAGLSIRDMDMKIIES